MKYHNPRQTASPLVRRGISLKAFHQTVFAPSAALRGSEPSGVFQKGIEYRSDVARRRPLLDVAEHPGIGVASRIASVERAPEPVEPEVLPAGIGVSQPLRFESENAAEARDDVR